MKILKFFLKPSRSYESHSEVFYERFSTFFVSIGFFLSVLYYGNPNNLSIKNPLIIFGLAFIFMGIRQVIRLKNNLLTVLLSVFSLPIYAFLVIVDSALWLQFMVCAGIFLIASNYYKSKVEINIFIFIVFMSSIFATVKGLIACDTEKMLLFVTNTTMYLISPNISGGFFGYTEELVCLLLVSIPISLGVVLSRLFSNEIKFLGFSSFIISWYGIVMSKSCVAIVLSCIVLMISPYMYIRSTKKRFKFIYLFSLLSISSIVIYSIDRIVSMDLAQVDILKYAYSNFKSFKNIFLDFVIDFSDKGIVYKGVIIYLLIIICKGFATWKKFPIEHLEMHKIFSAENNSRNREIFLNRTTRNSDANIRNTTMHTLMGGAMLTGGISLIVYIVSEPIAFTPIVFLIGSIIYGLLVRYTNRPTSSKIYNVAMKVSFSILFFMIGCTIFIDQIIMLANF